MAEPNQLIWIPVSSGKSTESAESEACNVQHDSAAWPEEVALAVVTLEIVDNFGYLSAFEGSAQLVDCYARWDWDTIVVSNEIAVGAMLAVGTPFSKKYAADSIDFGTVSVYAKVRVNDVSEFYKVYIAISDSSNKIVSSADQLTEIPAMTDNNWKVINVANSSWSDWDVENLRVTLTFMGPKTGTGGTDQTVDVEWIAIRLSGDS